MVTGVDRGTRFSKAYAGSCRGTRIVFCAGIAIVTPRSRGHRRILTCARDRIAYPRGLTNSFRNGTNDRLRARTNAMDAHIVLGAAVLIVACGIVRYGCVDARASRGITPQRLLTRIDDGTHFGHSDADSVDAHCIFGARIVVVAWRIVRFGE